LPSHTLATPESPVLPDPPAPAVPAVDPPDPPALGPAPLDPPAPPALEPLDPEPPEPPVVVDPVVALVDPEPPVPIVEVALDELVVPDVGAAPAFPPEVVVGLVELPSSEHDAWTTANVQNKEKTIVWCFIAEFHMTLENA
jgi:hypothetical protein